MAPSFLRCRRFGPSARDQGRLTARAPTYVTPLLHRFRGAAQDILRKFRSAPRRPGRPSSRTARVPRESSD
jgi:hypothetical protein